MHQPNAVVQECTPEFDEQTFARLLASLWGERLSLDMLFSRDRASDPCHCLWYSLSVCFDPSSARRFQVRARVTLFVFGTL